MGSEVEYNVHLTEYPEAMGEDADHLADHLVPNLLVERGGALGGISALGISKSIIKWFNWWGITSDRERKTDHIRQIEQRLGMSGWRLPNGARFYLDNFFPDYSTPECISVKDLIAYEKAGERLLEEASRKLREDSNIGTKIFKKNSDRQGSTYACHENYLLSRGFFDSLVRKGHEWTLASWIFATFLVTRQIFAGSGKVGSDFGERVPYQLSQRADFIEQLASLATTASRPVINLRDNPYADETRYGRLHVIIGDSNMSEYSIFLKMGTTALVLAMLEDGWIPRNLTRLAPDDPVSAVKTISRDLTLSGTVLTKDGQNIRALDAQLAFLAAADEWYERRYRESHGPNPEYEEILTLWASTLGALGRDPESLSDTLDCRIKKRLVEGVLEESGHSLEDILVPGDAYDLALSTDFLYHSIHAEESHYAALLRDGFVRRLIAAQDPERAIIEPPSDTRAYLRSALVAYLSQFPDFRLSTSWHGVYAETGTYIRRVHFSARLPDPLRGTSNDAEYVFTGQPSLREIERRVREVNSP